jgi:hypothetical protein
MYPFWMIIFYYSITIKYRVHVEYNVSIVISWMKNIIKEIRTEYMLIFSWNSVIKYGFHITKKLTE